MNCNSFKSYPMPITLLLLLFSFINVSAIVIGKNSSSAVKYLKSKQDEERLRKFKEYSAQTRDEDSITPFEQFFQILKMDAHLIRTCTVESEHIGFYLYTKHDDGFRNEKLKFCSSTSLKKSRFSSDRKTVLYIHSALQEYQLYESIKHAYFEKQNINLVVVNWDYYSGYCEYFYIAASIAPKIGDITADMIGLFIDNGARLKDIHIIGHGLGAHIAGHVGRKFNKSLGRITGLDPAKIGFEGFIHLPALGKDAEFVDVIHTSAHIFGYGISEPVGHVDFYPNNAAMQPGCSFLNCRLCNHEKSVEFFVESIISKYYAVHCDTWDDFENGNCDRDNVVLMGEYVPKTARGTFYLTITNDKQSTLGRNGTGTGSLRS